MKSITIAVDGPAGSGKSTVARLVAEKLNLIHLDTGAIYRTIALKAIQTSVNIKNIDEVEKMLESTKADVVFDSENKQHMLLDGTDVTESIRTSEVSRAASDVAAIPAVRMKLLGMQRSIAEKYPVILDGRDIGSCVLPNADLKIYLTASETERAKRRLSEMQNKGLEMHTTIEQMAEEIKQRDYQDSHREIAPLTVAKDAMVIDTTNLNIAQVCDKIIELAGSIE